MTGRNRLLLTLVGATLVLGALSFVVYKSPREVQTPTPTAIPTNESEDWKLYTFEQIGLTFKAPPELEVTIDLEAPALYIQKGIGGQSDYYQLYGLYQSGSQFSSVSLEDYKPDLDNPRDVTIGGLPAIEGQIKGERNRFVTHIKTVDGVFSLFTAEPTAENKALTDQILATFEFINPIQTTSQKCGVCGPKGVHNVDGAICAAGFVCKSGKTTTARYCVAEGEDVSVCESNEITPTL